MPDDALPRPLTEKKQNPVRFEECTGALDEGMELFLGVGTCRFDEDEDLIYTLAKAIYEGYDIYKSSHPESPRWNIDNAVNMDLLNNTGLPYHAASVKLFKEIGRWTDAHEKWQQSRLAFRDKIQQEYKKALEAAKAKNISIKDKEFGDIWFPTWQKMRAELAATTF